MKRLAKRILEYSGTGAWIYTQRVLAWTSDREIVSQLPVWLRIFCLYANLYRRLVGSRTIIFGHGVFHLTRRLGRRNEDFLRLCIKGQDVWLDPNDPGFMWGIQELTGKSTMALAIEEAGREADLFVDVGANQGYFSLLAANSGMNVIAIEPQPRLFDCMRRSLDASDVNFSGFNVAVGTHSASMHLVVPKENGGEAHLGTGGGEMAGGDVVVTTLDVLLSNVPSTSRVVMKLDIEGMEPAALRGAASFIGKFRPKLMLEVNPQALLRYDESVESLCRLLLNLGYSTWRDLEHPSISHSIECLEDKFQNIILEPDRSDPCLAK